MKSTTVTNTLLAVIAALLLLNLLAKTPGARVEADTFKLDDCITEKAGDRPTGYVHVVTH
ncbi:MAG: hypothetical protein PHR74_02760 [Candidatus Omnitrophica bacterium]|nr:hypothetical protein [Candidatus Omnitrophota bacterium]